MKYLLSCLLTLGAACYAAPLNNNGQIHIVEFEDGNSLNYVCQQQASGLVSLVFLVDKKAYPFVISCGVGA